MLLAPRSLFLAVASHESLLLVSPLTSQLFIIIVFTQGIGWVFSFIRQPKVIAEVIGGIILGPTVMGRIPGFTNAIFPTQSISYLNLIATIGLILFLFLVGLEVDLGVMRRNGRASALISAAGMILPFGMGAGIAVPIYNNFVDETKTTFGHFLLFVGVAISITAFPVLCRILTSCKLLDTRVGVIVLAAGVGNDVVGWILLALTLALVNASSGVVAVYVLLCAVGWSIILLWPIKKVFRWLARRTGSMDGHGPTPMMMVVTLLIVFASAFVTDIIGSSPPSLSLTLRCTDVEQVFTRSSEDSSPASSSRTREASPSL
jgi:Kef-type K+ transport system membrane component KefB